MLVVLVLWLDEAAEAVSEMFREAGGFAYEAVASTAASAAAGAMQTLESPAEAACMQASFKEQLYRLFHEGSWSKNVPLIRIIFADYCLRRCSADLWFEAASAAVGAAWSAAGGAARMLKTSFGIAN